MYMDNSNEIELAKCRMDEKGIVTCPIPKSILDKITAKQITPSKLVFEVDGT